MSRVLVPHTKTQFVEQTSSNLRAKFSSDTPSRRVGFSLLHVSMSVKSIMGICFSDVGQPEVVHRSFLYSPPARVTSLRPSTLFLPGVNSFY